MKHTFKSMPKIAATFLLLLGLTACGNSSGNRIYNEFKSRIDMTLLPAWDYNGNRFNSPSYYVDETGAEAIPNSVLTDSESTINISYFDGNKIAVVDNKRLIDIHGRTVYESDGKICPTHSLNFMGIDNRYIEEVDREYRLISSDGSIISELEESPISSLASKYIATEGNGNTYLYCLSDGQQVFPDPEGDTEDMNLEISNERPILSTYYPNLLLVKDKNRQLGLYDLEKHKFQIEPGEMPDYGSYGPVDINRCMIVRSDKYGLIDIDGNELIEPQFSDMETDGEWYKVSVDGLIGWCDKNGNYTIEPQFKTIAGNNSADRFLWDKWAYIPSEHCYIDRKGNVVLEIPGYIPILPYINDKVLVRLDDSKWTETHVWLDREGNEVSERFRLQEPSVLTIIADML